MEISHRKVLSGSVALNGAAVGLFFTIYKVEMPMTLTLDYSILVMEYISILTHGMCKQFLMFVVGQLHICHFLLMHTSKTKQTHNADMLATWPTLPWRRPSLVSTLQTRPTSRRTRSTTSWAMVVGATSAAGATILHRDPITGLRH